MTMKNKGVAYILWCACLIGFCGLHRLYIGKIGTGLLWLFTFGLLGIGQFVDLFILGGQVDLANLQGGFSRGYGNMNENRQNQNVIVNVTTPTAVPSTTWPMDDMEQRKVQTILSPTDELERLVSLFERGHLTQEEFNERKEKILSMDRLGSEGTV